MVLSNHWQYSSGSLRLSERTICLITRGYPISSCTTISPTLNLHLGVNLKDNNAESFENKLIGILLELWSKIGYHQSDVNGNKLLKLMVELYYAAFQV